MSVIQYIAQTAADFGIPAATLAAYGPLGIFSGFFMLISFKLLGLGGRLVDAVKSDNAELRAIFKNLAHDMEGLRRAMLADLIDRDNVGHHTKMFAQREIAKMDAKVRSE